MLGRRLLLCSSAVVDSSDGLGYVQVLLYKNQFIGRSAYYANTDGLFVMPSNDGYLHGKGTENGKSSLSNHDCLVSRCRVVLRLLQVLKFRTEIRIC